MRAVAAHEHAIQPAVLARIIVETRFDPDIDLARPIDAATRKKLYDAAVENVTMAPMCSLTFVIFIVWVGGRDATALMSCLPI